MRTMPSHLVMSNDSENWHFRTNLKANEFLKREKMDVRCTEWEVLEEQN